MSGGYNDENKIKNVMRTVIQFVDLSAFCWDCGCKEKPDRCSGPGIVQQLMYAHCWSAGLAWLDPY